MNSDFNSAFWITMTGLIIGFLGVIIKFCLKSKCKTCSLCFGLIKIERDVDAENKEEQMEINAGINPF
jgi:hypothetical protein